VSLWRSPAASFFHNKNGKSIMNFPHFVILNFFTLNNCGFEWHKQTFWVINFPRWKIKFIFRTKSQVILRVGGLKLCNCNFHAFGEGNFQSRNSLIDCHAQDHFLPHQSSIQNNSQIVYNCCAVVTIHFYLELILLHAYECSNSPVTESGESFCVW
jgi:hypothetical protein